MFRYLTLLGAFVFFWSNSLNAQAWKGEVNADLPVLEAKAKEGDPEAMAEYAYHSMRCMGEIKYQPDLILDYFTRSAATGNTDAQAGLAHCYAFNVGTIRDLQKAEELLKEPFKQNHPVALKVMAYFYYGTNDIRPEDLAKVHELNAKAAELGCIGAKYNVTIGYIKGNPVLDLEKGMGDLRAMHEARIFPMASAYLLQTLRTNEIWPDHDEVYKDCVQRLSEYAKLDEPYCLFTLGGFHHNAGDLENAVACYARSANLGNGQAYYNIWRMVKYGQNLDYGTVWTQNRQRGNLALLCYRRGAWNFSALADAGWEITRMSNTAEYQKLLPQLEKDCLVALKKGRVDMHECLGRIYRRAKVKDNPQLVKPAWALAHQQANVTRSKDAANEFVYVCFQGKTVESKAQGYAAMKWAIKMGNPVWHNAKRKKWVNSQMTPESRKRAEELIADGFPNEKKYRIKAEEFLIKIGHLDELSEELQD